MAAVWNLETWFKVFPESRDIEVGASFDVQFDELEIADNPLFEEVVYLWEYDDDADRVLYENVLNGGIQFPGIGGLQAKIVDQRGDRDDLLLIHRETTLRPSGQAEVSRDWARRFSVDKFDSEYDGVQEFAIAAIVAPAYRGNARTSRTIARLDIHP